MAAAWRPHDLKACGSRPAIDHTLQTINSLNVLTLVYNTIADKLTIRLLGTPR